MVLSLVFLAIFIITIILDSSFNRKHRGLGRVQGKCAYNYTCCVTLIPYINALTLIRNATPGNRGVLISILAVNFFSSLILFLYQRMATMAATVSTAAPLMFPLYFMCDLIQTYLFLTPHFMSEEFWILLVTQEIVGVLKNCGASELLQWFEIRILGFKKQFPLADQRILEELQASDAADTIAEILASPSLLLMPIGSLLVGAETMFACKFETRSHCIERYIDFGKAAQSLSIVALSRVFWFKLEEKGETWRDERK